MNQEARKEFFKAVARIKSSEGAQKFFQDLLSGSEIRDITRRFKCARLLYQDETYQTIEELLGMGPLTIAKIHTKTRTSEILPKLFKSSQGLYYRTIQYSSEEVRKIFE